MTNKNHWLFIFVGLICSGNLCGFEEAIKINFMGYCELECKLKKWGATTSKCENGYVCEGQGRECPQNGEVRGSFCARKDGKKRKCDLEALAENVCRYATEAKSCLKVPARFMPQGNENLYESHIEIVDKIKVIQKRYLELQKAYNEAKTRYEQAKLSGTKKRELDELLNKKEHYKTMLSNYVDKVVKNYNALQKEEKRLKNLSVVWGRCLSSKDYSCRASDFTGPKGKVNSVELCSRVYEVQRKYLKNTAIECLVGNCPQATQVNYCQAKFSGCAKSAQTCYSRNDHVFSLITTHTGEMCVMDRWLVERSAGGTSLPKVKKGCKGTFWCAKKIWVNQRGKLCWTQGEKGKGQRCSSESYYNGLRCKDGPY